MPDPRRLRLQLLGLLEDRLGRLVRLGRLGHLGRLGQAVRRAVRQAVARGRLPRARRRRPALAQAIVDGAAAAIYVKDAAGRFLLANRHYESLRGKSRDEIVGRRDDEVGPPETAEAAEAAEAAENAELRRDADRRVVASGAAIASEEEMVCDGDPRTWWTVRFPLLDLDGRAYAVCGISTDVTDRKLLEARLRQGERLEAIGRLAGGLARELDDLLTVVLGYGTLLARELAAQRRLLSQVEQLRQAGERGAVLTRQLVAFSRRQSLRSRPFDLDAAIVDFAAMLRHLLGDDIELATVLRSGGSLALADRAQLEQVLLELALNARDAMPGGGRLILETAGVELGAAHVERHPEARPGPHVLLAVSDTGQGIDAAIRSRIFEPFFTTKPPGQGAGLGLATVYGIVRQSGGHVEVVSGPGRGATFRIYLPRIATPAQDASRAEAPPRPAARGGLETILLVEGQDLLRTVVQITLRAAGYTVLAANTAAGALILATHLAGPIHLLLCDPVMPEMSGPELAARIAARRPEARILFTSDGGGQLLDGNPLAPPAPFLARPFRPDELLRKVREALDDPRDGPTRGWR